MKTIAAILIARRDDVLLPSTVSLRSPNAVRADRWSYFLLLQSLRSSSFLLLQAKSGSSKDEDLLLLLLFPSSDLPPLRSRPEGGMYEDDDDELSSPPPNETRWSNEEASNALASVRPTIVINEEGWLALFPPWPTFAQTKKTFSPFPFFSGRETKCVRERSRLHAKG